MKHRFILAILAIASFNWCMQAQTPNHDITVHGDTLEVISGADTVNVTVASDIANKIKGLLDDTVINNTEGTQLATIVSNAIQHQQEEDAWQLRMLKKYEREMRQMHVVEEILVGVATVFIIIVALCLFFYYLNRRQKYRIIEKAIENNYELPPSITGKHPQAPIQPAAPNSATANPYYRNQPANEPYAPQSQVRYAQAPKANVNYQPNQYYMPAFKNGIIWTAIGLGLCLFFLTADGEEMAALCLIPIIIGVSKLAMEFITQRNRINYENWKAEQEWMAQNDAQSEDEAIDNQTSNNNNETTPPPFGN